MHVPLLVSALGQYEELFAFKQTFLIYYHAAKLQQLQALSGGYITCIVSLIVRLNHEAAVVARQICQNPVKPFFPPDALPCGITLRTLNRTVLDKGLHCPIITVSPSLQRKQGEMWAGTFLCLFSYL